MRRWALLLLSAALALLLLGAGLALSGSAAGNGSVSGQVLAAGTPLVGARVRVRATEHLTFTSAGGTFLLTGLAEGEKVEITAWAEDYYIASDILTPTVAGVTLTLRPFHQQDHPDYQWVSPISGTSASACGNCHPMILSQWISNAHGTAVSNPRFFSLYNGTDLTGTVPITPGFVNDFPGTSGNCANCHAPGLGVDNYLGTDMNSAREIITAGIHCDFCHKLGGVYLDPASGTVYPNAPGVQALRVLRPPAGDDIFFGPYDDIHDPDTYLPLISESQFCAPCHQFSMWGTPIYESYNEWLASPYAERGVTCQDCHMPPSGDTHFALPAVGGLPHPPETIPSHLQLGATAEDLLQNTVSMTLSVRQVWNQVEATVIITNSAAGHHLPTDFPGRQVILLLTASDSQGEELAQLSGPAVPDWGGEEAGKPGKVYAKLLQDLANGDMPVVSYWKQAIIASDNRIPALEADGSHYTFAIPAASGPVTVTAQLLFRRVFAAESESRGWDRPDLVMETRQASLQPAPAWLLYLPLLENSAQP